VKASVVAHACCYNPDEDSYPENEEGDHGNDEGEDKPDTPGPKPYKSGDDSKGYKPRPIEYPQQKSDYGGYATQQSAAAGATPAQPATTATPAAAAPTMPAPTFNLGAAQPGMAARAPHLIG
jgi:hypothetical protein